MGDHNVKPWMMKAAEDIWNGDSNSPEAKAEVAKRIAKHAPRVKALEWKDRDSAEGGYWFARTPFVEYRLYKEEDGGFRSWFAMSGLGFDSETGTIEEAKAAAQADYERRVWECFEGGNA